jgi:cysteinyl-tRNA synthetase
LKGLAVDAGADPSGLATIASEAVESFRGAMDNDFNSAAALAVVFGFVSSVNAALDAHPAVIAADRDAALAALHSMDEVLGLLEVASASRVVDDDLAAYVEQKIQERSEARANRDFATSDAIRDELTGKGIVLEDGPDGTRWKVG